MINFRFIFLVLTLLISQISFATAQEHEIVIDQTEFSISVARGVSFLEDKTGNLSVSEVIKLSPSEFSTFEGDTLDFGYSDSSYWFKFSVTYNGQGSPPLAPRTKQSYISIRYSMLDDIEVFQARNGVFHEQALGDKYSFDQRSIKLNDFVIPVWLDSSETEFIIKVKSSSVLLIPIYIQSDTDFIENQHISNTTNGIYFGIAIGLCIYNLFLWLGMKKAVYGIYVLTIISIVLFNATMAGYTFRFNILVRMYFHSHPP
jgi:diguanylate cyclase